MESRFQGYEVLGHALQSYVDALPDASTLIRQILASHGLGTTGTDGKIKIDPDAWYPLDSNIKALEEISNTLGPAVLHQIGLKVPETAVFLSSVKDVESALQAVTTAYLTNHRYNGQVLFDPATNRIVENTIGTYRYQRIGGKSEIFVTSDTPYPCDLDRGLLTTSVRRIQPNVWVFHDDSKPCRKKGGASCTYQVRWA